MLYDGKNEVPLMTSKIKWREMQKYRPGQARRCWRGEARARRNVRMRIKNRERNKCFRRNQSSRNNGVHQAKASNRRELFSHENGGRLSMLQYAVTASSACVAVMVLLQSVSARTAR